jgi:hypothetical protein
MAFSSSASDRKESERHDKARSLDAGSLLGIAFEPVQENFRTGTKIPASVII